MAGMFYSLKEVAERLNKTEDEVRAIVKQGRLREFRDGPNLLFKVDEVESLMSDSSIMLAKESSGAPIQTASEDEILLAPETETPEPPAGGDNLTDEDTMVASEGINVLDEADGDYHLAGDTMSETKAVSDETVQSTANGEASLEKIEEDVNLDTFGSGSGLLDLSLQADDTSLGGILDEIYTSEGEGAKDVTESPLAEAAPAAEQILPEEEAAAPQSGLESPVMAMALAYAEPAPDRSSNIFGLMLVLPLLAVIYTLIVAVTGFNNTIPAILKQIQGLILPVLGGVVVVALVLTGVGFMPAGSGIKTAKPKVKKEKKSKKAKGEAPPPAPEDDTK